MNGTGDDSPVSVATAVALLLMLPSVGILMLLVVGVAKGAIGGLWCVAAAAAALVSVFDAVAELVSIFFCFVFKCFFFSQKSE